MVESVQGRQLARLIAVLLGVVLWSPTFGVGLVPQLAQASQATAARASIHRQPSHEGPEGQFGEALEAEDSEVEDSLADGLSGAVGLHSHEDASRMAGPLWGRPRLSAEYSMFARERGPPVIRDALFV